MNEIDHRPAEEAEHGETTEGYVKDTIFPSGYIGHLQPALLSYVAAANGFPPPDPDSQFNYIELGCGIGATLNVLAAANPDCHFVGIDFNPTHIDYARNDARTSNLSNVTYIESSFSTIIMADLPECDYISIHGAYSWLPPPEQAGVHAIVSEKLKSGGLFFVDYISAPARVPIDPVWVFLREVTRNTNGKSEQRVAEGMEILGRLGAADVGYIANTPSAKAVLLRNLRKIDNGNQNVLSHLAHHALAEHQEPKFFHEVQRTLGDCGLAFAGSTFTKRNDPALCLPADIQELCNSQKEENVRELIKDFTLNENQRKDVFVKSDNCDEATARDYLRNKLFLHSMRPANLVLNKWTRQFQNWRTPHKPDAAAHLILKCMDEGKVQFADMERAGEEKDVTFDALVRAINLLLHRSDIKVCRRAPRQNIEGFHAVNRSPDLLNMASDDSRLIIASPVLGGGLVMGQGMRDLLTEAQENNFDDEQGESQPPLGDNALNNERNRAREAGFLSRLAQLEVLG